MSTPPLDVVVVRHSHSEWNLCHRFTGWTDISLTEIGLAEAAAAGRQLAALNYRFDELHTSALQRTKQTAEAILSAAQHPDIPHYSSWRLNERHYGQLQGLNKQQIFDSWGEAQSRQWWRGYHVPPPPLDEGDPRHPRFDPLYRELADSLLPASESLQQCQQRLIPYWDEVISPAIQAGRRALIISHGNTMRSLHMHLLKLSPLEIENLEIPSAVPLLYRFDQQMRLTSWQWLTEESTAS